MVCATLVVLNGLLRTKNVGENTNIWGYNSFLVSIPVLGVHDVKSFWKNLVKVVFQVFDIICGKPCYSMEIGRAHV